MAGLRGRFSAAMALISALTLAFAAVALLSPLEHRLRADELEDLVRAAKGYRHSLSGVPLRALAPSSQRALEVVRTVRRRSGAAVTLLDNVGRVIASTDPDLAAPVVDAAMALRRHHIQRGIVGEGKDALASVALPVVAHGHRYALVLRRRLDDPRRAAAVVRGGFEIAAVISLAVAVSVGVALAGRLVRRLRELRDMALDVAGEPRPLTGSGGSRSRDEVDDLTRALETMKRRLQQHERARRAFVATASHELRTPLSSLRLMLGLAREDLEQQDPEVADASDRIRDAEDQVDRLSALARDLLDLSRIDDGVVLRCEPIAVADLVRSVLAEFNVRVSDTRHRLELDGETSVWARGDPGSVARIVRILVENAVRYAPRGSEIAISVQRRDSMTALVVRDDGPGIGPADRERIFERFERGATPADASGFGLGLAIARELARRMEGDLVLEPAEPGATFVLTLPLDATTPTAPAGWLGS